MKGSWKTSLFGWVILIGALVTGLKNLLDGDPTTTIDFAAILDAFKNVGFAIPAGIGLIFSRDKDVSTEEQRAASKK